MHVNSRYVKEPKQNITAFFIKCILYAALAIALPDSFLAKTESDLSLQLNIKE
jgi:hypothetical protein